MKKRSDRLFHGITKVNLTTELLTVQLFSIIRPTKLDSIEKLARTGTEITAIHSESIMLEEVAGRAVEQLGFSVSFLCSRVPD